MKKFSALLILFLLQLNISFAQDKFSLYDVNADPYKQLSDAKIKASTEHKNILIQAGGNWCSWCRLFHKFSQENKKVDSILNADYVVLHINYSKEKRKVL